MSSSSFVPERSQQRRLADDIELDVVYEDTTRFGGLSGRRLITEIRQRAEPIFRHWHSEGGSATIARTAPLLELSLRGALGELYAGPDTLHPELLYPAPAAIVPRALSVLRNGQELARLPLSPALVSELARWIGEWARGARAPRASEARALFEALDALQAFTAQPVPVALLEAGGHFIGHATVAVGNASSGRLLVDPYLLPTSSRLPAGYSPIVAAQLTNLAAVCITHCHPDHFCVGALLKLGADTLILVPRVPRESALSIDMRARLVELGFTRVEELEWGQTRALPGGRVTALPFHGEQPTTSRRLHEQVRNEGNTYLLEVDGARYLAVADSGKDGQGEAIAVAERLRAKVGQLDVLFGGYRSFPLYPIEYLPSSVPQYLLFTAREDWGRRQKIMYDAEELLDLAECWGAQHLVPYACGGAPWYWQRGLGPMLDGQHSTSRSDPVPEVVQVAGEFRTGTESAPHRSPVHVAILRPGDGFTLAGEELQVTRQESHAWPYAPPERAVTGAPLALDGRAEGPRFLQWNVAVPDVASDVGRERVWQLLRCVAPVIVELKAAGGCTTFFFQSKEPGIRLRVGLAPGAPDPSAELVAALESARALGAIAGHASGVYEPEWRVFGGHESMAVVHRHFDADTSVLVDRLALERCSMPLRVLPVEVWLAHAIDDLVVRCLGEGNECWDVYSSLLERHGELEMPPSVALLPRHVSFESRGEYELFQRYTLHNQQLASSLQQLAHDGKLSAGRRAVVANVVQFRLNRHALSPELQQAILICLRATRDPALRRAERERAGE